jgi:predicted HTH transcriptional regulator
MATTPKKENHALSTILTLGGIFLGAFLITKLTHQETSSTPLSKESGGKKKEEEIQPDEGSPRAVLEKEVEEKILGLNERQARILKVVKEKGIVTPKDLQILVPDVSSRTLRRDMDVLAKEKYISQKGSTKSTFYKYIGR